MKDKIVSIAKQKAVAIVTYENKKQDLIDWARFSREALAGHNLIAQSYIQ